MHIDLSTNCCSEGSSPSFRPTLIQDSDQLLETLNKEGLRAPQVVVYQLNRYM